MGPEQDNAKKFRLSKICFLCGEGGARTTEHIIPKSFYGGPLPNDVLTLPSHRECNAHTAPFEEDFRDFVAASAAPRPGEDQHPVWKAAWRGLNKPEAKRRKLDYFKKIVPRAEVRDGEREVVPWVVQIDEEPVHWVLAKIVKGLYSLRTGGVLSGRGLCWCIGRVTQIPEDFPALNGFDVHDVLRVRYGRSAEEPVSVWLLSVLGTVPFYVATDVQCQDGERAACSHEHIWPGPTSAP